MRHIDGLDSTKLQARSSYHTCASWQVNSYHWKLSPTEGGVLHIVKGVKQSPEKSVESPSPFFLLQLRSEPSQVIAREFIKKTSAALCEFLALSPSNKKTKKRWFNLFLLLISFYIVNNINCFKGSGGFAPSLT